MSPLIIGLVAFSAVLHVAWNVRLKTAGDPLRAATVGMLAARARHRPGRGHLVGARRVADPVARRRAARADLRDHRGRLLHPAVGGLSTGRPLGRLPAGARHRARSWRSSSGSGCWVSGSAWPARSGSRSCWSASSGSSGRGSSCGARRGFDPSIAFAIATGVTIAIYSAVDRVGTRLIDPVPYAAILWLTTCVVLVVWVTFVAGGGIFDGGREQVRRAAVGGMLTLGAYLCILIALSVAPLSGVAPVARVGHGLRRRLGVRSARRGREPGRGDAPGRFVRADRRRGAAARRRVRRGGGRLRSGGTSRLGPRPRT